MDLYQMTEKLENFAMEEMSKEKSCIDTKELGEVIDMVKDLLQARKYKAEAKYYDSITDAMEDATYGQDYDYRGKLGYPMNSSRMGMNMRVQDGNYRMLPQTDERMGYSRTGRTTGGNVSGGRSSSRYGYSHDEYMDSKKQYSSNNPEDIEHRKELLNDYMNDLQDMAKDMISDMTPEEKQMWKVKINKIMNM